MVERVQEYIEALSWVLKKISNPNSSVQVTEMELYFCYRVRKVKPVVFSKISPKMSAEPSIFHQLCIWMWDTFRHLPKEVNCTATWAVKNSWNMSFHPSDLHIYVSSFKCNLSGKGTSFTQWSLRHYIASIIVQ